MAEEKVEQPQEKAKKSKKLNKLTLAEVEKKIEDVKNTQGGFSSRYARELRHRKDILRSQGKK
jgi:hypothetical protein